MANLENFEFFTPTKIIFGNGSVESDLPTVIKSMNAGRIMLVTDGGVAKAGLADKVGKVIDGCKVPYFLFDKVTPDPLVETVMEGVELARGEKCDLIVGLGGGSSMDAAKVVSLLLKHGGEVGDFEGVGIIPDDPLVPLVGIPTTAGTGAEVTAAALVTDRERGEKISLIGPRLTYDVAVVDPAMTATMPPKITASTGMDVITHAIEGVVSLLCEPIVEVIGLHALKLAAANLRGAVSDGKNMEHRRAMSLASVMAGICIRHAIAGADHAMAHAAGGLFHVPHGTGCGMFLADVMEFNLDFAAEKFAGIAEAMGLDVSGLSDEDAGRKGIEEVRKIYDDVGLPKTLGEFGVKADDVERLADTAAGDGCVFMNPRPLEVDDFKELFGKFV